MELPILASRDEFLGAIRENQVVIVVGETGSGKTTQLPIFLYEAGFANGRRIGITEPRRIAAISVAEFVADALQTMPGEVVGYKIRFDDTTADETSIKFMTDGILLRELQEDPDLSDYSVIMIDEAHERSQNIDFVLGLLKDLLARRDDLKVVVASATIDQNKFSNYFWNAPVVSVQGRMFPVEVEWAEEDTKENDMADAVIAKVSRIHRFSNEGDILVFMTGEADIRKVVTGLEELKLSGVVILPVYGSLPPEDQKKIFLQYHGRRKIVVATNIAETSITVDGVVYVVDSGLIKQAGFDPLSGIQSLDIVRHSQSGCDQRAGRAGRTQSGVCYRMYTKEDYERRPKYTEPEIRRTSLASIVLAMEDIGIENIKDFDFVDPPEAEAFREAYETLIALGAIERGKKGLLEIGKAMARLPLEPRIARMVLEAEKYNCVEAVATIAALLSVRSIFARPKGKEKEADAAHEYFKEQHPDSDLMVYLDVWNEYEESGFSTPWCFENFLNSKSLDEVKKIRTQLFDILKLNGIEITENGSDEDIMKAVAAGLVYNLFHKEGTGFDYTGVLRNCRFVFVHPGSTLFSYVSPRWFVATSIVQTTKVFARGCSRVDIEWLPEIAPQIASFGNIQKIVSVLPDGSGAIVNREILFHGNPVGFADVKIPLETARSIQERMIADAHMNGWIKLSFTENQDSYGLSEYTAFANGRLYKAFDRIHIKEGVLYYCEVDMGFIFDIDLHVRIRLAVFPELMYEPGPDPGVNSSPATTAASIPKKELPKPAGKPAVPNQEPKPTNGRAGLEALAKKFAEKVGM